MSNLIPPLLSSSPPPIIGPLEEDDDDEFGDFRAAAGSYDCDDLSLPPSPQKSPEKEIKSDLPKVNLDINSNSKKITCTTDKPAETTNKSIDKDFQDRRKSTDESFNSAENQVNCSYSHFVTSSNECQIETSSVEEPIKINFDDSTDQKDVFNDECGSDDDDFADLQCGIDSTTNCKGITIDDDLETGTNKFEIDEIANSPNNKENLFEDFSESVQIEKTNSDDLSELNETNEIKSDDGLEEINSELVDEGDKNDTSLKESNCESSEISLSLKVGESDPKLSDDEDGDDDDDDFGNFADHFNAENQQVEGEEEEFDDFVSPLPPPKPRQEEEKEDEFGEFASSDLTKDDLEEFADFSSHTCSSYEKPVLLEIDEKNAVAKSETIVKEVFPALEEEVDDFENVDETQGDRIFEELKDITETNALLYQWSKSNSQKMFLKALNIDMRNILYGPAWNASMPRFAANLGLTPLEPVKSEILTPTPVTQQPASSPSNSSQKNQNDIPTAQFDWSGSGLINPLDSAPTDQPGNVPEESSQSQILADFLPNSEKTEPLSSLFDSEIVQKPQSNEQSTPESNSFELPKPSSAEKPDNTFTPFQSPKLMIPLRETHISGDILNDFSGAKPGWLEPTILTPDLPRKEPIVDPDDDDDDDDEFDDFQMVLPEEKTDVKSTLSDLSEFQTTSSAVKSNLSDLSGFDVAADTTTNKHIVESPKQVDDDDEFTDFHSHASLPPPASGILQPLQPVPLEPLKPAVQYAPPAPTQINWPEPGVTDEDIRNIELTYSRKQAEKNDQTGRESSADDDEWTDFVSVTTQATQSPSVKPAVPERTATPDLPLSVLNLNHVQPPKQPIPVITPSGLIQTKLSSNILLQPKSSNVVQTAVQPNLYRPPQQGQFSTISSQFSANLFQSNGLSAGQDDDDDWSEFVSSQPVTPQPVKSGQVSNGCQQKTPHVNWTNATTNIIMNPSHFANYVPQNKKTQAKSVPSVSAIPDLEFIAPKNRTKK